MIGKGLKRTRTFIASVARTRAARMPGSMAARCYLRIFLDGLSNKCQEDIMSAYNPILYSNKKPIIQSLL